MFTPEDFNEQHQLIAQTTEDFANNEIVPNIDKIEHKDFALTRELIKKASELGISSVDVPEEYGGMEMDKMSSAIIADRIAKSGSFSVSFLGHSGIGTLPIVYFGTEEQKKKYVPRLASGELVGAYALSESSSGSDALNCRTKAVLSPDGKHYVLNGEKMWITNASFADVFIIFAKIDGEKFTAFIVERGYPGFSVGAEEHKMGIRGSSTCPLILNDCKVPVENLLGDIGKGHIIAFNILNIGRFKLGAACVGGARNSLQSAIGYAKQRKAFGKTIADFGMIREKLANMAAQIYAGEAVTYRTVGMMDVALNEVDKAAPDANQQTRKAIEEYAVECSIIKVWGSEMLDYVVDETVQIYGGYGFVEEYPAERAYRDSRVNRIFEGTNEINRQIAIGWMLKKAMSGPTGADAGDQESAGRGDGRTELRRRPRGSTGGRASDHRQCQEDRAVCLRIGLAEVHAGDRRAAGDPGRAGRYPDRSLCGRIDGIAHAKAGAEPGRSGGSARDRLHAAVSVGRDEPDRGFGEARDRSGF